MIRISFLMGYNIQKVSLILELRQKKELDKTKVNRLKIWLIYKIILLASFEALKIFDLFSKEFLKSNVSNGLLNHVPKMILF